MTRPTPIQIAVYVLGLLLMLSVLVTGPILEADLKQLGLSGYLQQRPWQDGILFFGFVFAFPAGLLICVVAGLLVNTTTARLLLTVVSLGLAVACLVIAWPALIGRQDNPQYFALGGALLLFLIAGSAWYWAKQRRQCEPRHRLATDLRGFGYFCFAMATWHVCGAGGLPGFAIYSESDIHIKHYPFLIGQFKVVMLYLILAWVGVLLSLSLDKRQRTN